MQAQSPRTVRDGVYTDAQATRGSAIYKRNARRATGRRPAAASRRRSRATPSPANWGGPLSAIVDKIQATMPANAMGTLTRAQSADVLAFMLQTSKFPAGRAELSSEDAALKTITLPGAQVAAVRPAAPGSAADVSASRQHGAAHARRALSGGEHDLQRPALRPRDAAQAEQPVEGGGLLVGGLGRRRLHGMGDSSTTPPSRSARPRR